MKRKQYKEMCSYIDIAIDICQQYRDDHTYELYHNRYKKLLQALKNMKLALINDSLYTKRSNLGIVKMIIDNDPKELYDIVITINNYFRDNYSSVLS